MFNLSNETTSFMTPVSGGIGVISSTVSCTSSSNLTNVTDQTNSINLIINKLGRILLITLVEIFIFSNFF